MQKPQQMLVQSLGWEDPLEEEMATQSSILAWRIPWTEETGGLWSMGSQSVRHDRVTSTHSLTHLLFQIKSIVYMLRFTILYLIC